MIRSNKLTQMLDQHDWYYEMADDSDSYMNGKDNLSKLRKEIHSLIKLGETSYVKLTIEDFLQEKCRICYPTDFHFYLEPLYKILKETKITIEREYE